ncbi:FAD-binding oxidoreductase [Actinomycetes bacterium M1A6_2h]
MGDAQVVQVHRLRRDITVVRLVGDFVPFHAGQSVSVTVPQSPRVPRRYSPALPPSLDGKFEFHVRAVPAGWVSGSIVADTRVGDVWRIDSPEGDLFVDDSGRDVVMIAGGTGLAPMRALILDLARWERPPSVHLFVGGRSPRDLYAADMLSLLAAQLPWLRITPVVDNPADPPFSDEWFARADLERQADSPQSGFRQDQLVVGRVGDVAASFGPFVDRQVLVCGSPGMVDATVRSLRAAGTPAEAIAV